MVILFCRNQKEWIDPIQRARPKYMKVVVITMIMIIDITNTVCPENKVFLELLLSDEVSLGV